MRTHARRRSRPRVEDLENRRLLSQAVVEIENESTYTVKFGFQWTTYSTPQFYTVAPGHYELLWATYSSAFTPEVTYNTTTASNSQTVVRLAQGYGEWDGSGDPPTSSATLYEIQDTSTGLGLYYAAPPTPTQAVVEILNESTYTITFDFLWTPSSTPKAYTEGPGQGEIFWTTFSSAPAPEAEYNTTTSPFSGTTVRLAQGYGEWTGNGTPPASSATLYQFQNISNGVQLYYAPVAPAPTPGPAPDATPTPNWSGYIAATNLSRSAAGFGDRRLRVVERPGGIRLIRGQLRLIHVDRHRRRLPVRRDGGADWDRTGRDQRRARLPGVVGDVLDGGTAARTGHQKHDDLAGRLDLRLGAVHHERRVCRAVPAPDRRHEPPERFVRPDLCHFGQHAISPGRCESAEWIMEAPSVIVNGSLVPMPMPTFSTVKFTDATAVIDGISGGIISPSWQSSADVVAVQDQHSNWVPVDTTSVLGNSGESFAVTSDSSVGAGVSQAAVLGTRNRRSRAAIRRISSS